MAQHNLNLSNTAAHHLSNWPAQVMRVRAVAGDHEFRCYIPTDHPHATGLLLALVGLNGVVLYTGCTSPGNPVDQDLYYPAVVGGAGYVPYSEKSLADFINAVNSEI